MKLISSSSSCIEFAWKGFANELVPTTCPWLLSRTLCIIFSKIVILNHKLLTELVVEIEVSHIIELQIRILACVLLIVFTARYRNQMKIADDDDSKLRSVELSVVRLDISGKQRSSPQFFCFRVNR